MLNFNGTAVTIYVTSYKQLQEVYKVLADLKSVDFEHTTLSEKTATSLSTAALPKETAIILDDTNIVQDNFDSAGVEWNSEIHSNNKAKNKDGTWRLKRGFKKEEDIIDSEQSEISLTEIESVKEIEESGTYIDAGREWTDNDLSKICNQAAMKLTNPAPVRQLIAEFVPEGAIVHSRNIPSELRGNFAKALEAKAGISFEI